MRVTCHNKSGPFLIDIGAQASLCARRFVPKEIRINEAPADLNLIGVTGHQIETYGIAKLPLQLSPTLVVKQDCIICDDSLFQTKAGLLGIDFLSEQDALLRAKTNEMFVHGETIQLHHASPTTPEFYMVTSKKPLERHFKTPGERTKENQERKCEQVNLQK